MFGFRTGGTEYKNWAVMLNLYEALINCSCFKIAPRSGNHTLKACNGPYEGGKEIYCFGSGSEGF